MVDVFVPPDTNTWAPADHESLFEQLLALEGARRRIRTASEGISGG